MTLYERFMRLASQKTRMTKAGVRQFVNHQSRGITPKRPSKCFLALSEGKRWWDWTVEQYRLSYGTEHWHGWYQLERDFRDDKDGLKIIRRAIFGKKNQGKTKP